MDEAQWPEIDVETAGQWRWVVGMDEGQCQWCMAEKKWRSVVRERIAVSGRIGGTLSTSSQ